MNNILYNMSFFIYFYCINVSFCLEVNFYSLSVFSDDRAVSVKKLTLVQQEDGLEEATEKEKTNIELMFPGINRIKGLEQPYPVSGRSSELIKYLKYSFIHDTNNPNKKNDNNGFTIYVFGSGECSLKGEVEPIGGLPEKVLGVYDFIGQNNIPIDQCVLFLPYLENKKEFEKFEEILVKRGMSKLPKYIFFVDNIKGAYSLLNRSISEILSSKNDNITYNNVKNDEKIDLHVCFFKNFSLEKFYDLQDLLYFNSNLLLEKIKSHTLSDYQYNSKYENIERYLETIDRIKLEKCFISVEDRKTLIHSILFRMKSVIADDGKDLFTKFIEKRILEREDLDEVSINSIYDKCSKLNNEEKVEYVYTLILPLINYNDLEPFLRDLESLSGENPKTLLQYYFSRIEEDLKCFCYENTEYGKLLNEFYSKEKLS